MAKKTKLKEEVPKQVQDTNRLHMKRLLKAFAKRAGVEPEQLGVS